jgi:aspartate-semialdehyde dehydrogenase
LHDAAGVAAVRVSTYQSVSGAGAQRMEQLRNEPPDRHDLAMDWTWDDDETDEESKIRAEARKVLELPELPISATTVRVPVLVGHAEAVWLELEEGLTPEQATEVLAAAPSVRVVDVPTPGAAAQTDEVLVGRIRADRASRSGLVLFLACDNLVKGAALNAIQIAELLLSGDAGKGARTDDLLAAQRHGVG